ncbi:glycoside hydrolase family protein [Mariniluteicoccus flavus]
MTQTYRFHDAGTIVHHWCSGMRLEPGPVAKDPASPFFGEEMFAPDPRPYEARFDNGYPNVLWDDDAEVLRLYYTTFFVDPISAETPLDERGATAYVVSPKRRLALAYAESRDGVTWTKPDLGIIEFDGSTANNLLMRGAHGSGVLIDPDDPDPGRRFKLITRIDKSDRGHHMAVAFSADGLHFGAPRPWAVHNPVADTHNFVFRDPDSGRYVLITRIWRDGLRVQAVSTSDDFLDWSKPVECVRGVDAWNQIYAFPVMPLDGAYIGFGSIYHDGDRSREGWDTVDLVLMAASRVDTWQFPLAYRPLLERGSGVYPDAEFDAGCIYASAPVEIDGRWWLYYMGGNGRHTGFRETALGRAEIQLDRLAGYAPTHGSGTLVAGPFRVAGPDLQVHADVAEGGAVTCRLLDAETRDRTGADAAPLTGSGWQAVSFDAAEVSTGRDTLLVLECAGATVHGVRGDLVLDRTAQT